jgi:hypothetical protein
MSIVCLSDNLLVRVYYSTQPFSHCSSVTLAFTMSCIVCECEQRKSPASVLDSSSGAIHPDKATVLEPSSLFTNRNHGHRNGDDSAEKMISDSLMKMTVREREDVYSALHGVADQVEESNEFIAKCQLELDIELKKLKVRPAPLITLPPSSGPLYQPHATALNLAESLEPSYVNDPGLRLSFLRADCYNPSRAAGQ